GAVEPPGGGASALGGGPRAEKKGARRSGGGRILVRAPPQVRLPGAAIFPFPQKSTLPHPRRSSKLPICILHWSTLYPGLHSTRGYTGAPRAIIPELRTSRPFRYSNLKQLFCPA